ncbi:MAG: hypothetical protein ACAI38_04845 [Myxococcota bacterium]|nr:hypothetical protein [Myxococcota bacterium]
MNEPIDFSSLDPTTDAGFDQRVAEIARRASVKGVRPTLMTQVAMLWRFAVVGTAGAAIACWAAAAIRQPPIQPSASDALLAWAAHDDDASRATLLGSLEVRDER